jgi:hypothetical protein
MWGYNLEKSLSLSLVCTEIIYNIAIQMMRLSSPLVILPPELNGDSLGAR